MSTTTKLSRTEFKAVINAYILNAIPANTEIWDSWQILTESDKDRVNFVADCFESEYMKNNNQAARRNRIENFADWLQGLPSSFNIDFENYRILEIAKEWGALAQDASEAKQDRIISNWWNFIANKFFQLHTSLNKARKA